MKTFTKIFLAFTLVAFYYTGYAANLKTGLGHDGPYIPKNPNTPTNTEINIWSDKGGFSLMGSIYKPALEWMFLNTKELSKTINKPKRAPYNFTANANSSSMLGVNMINQGVTWDEGRLKASLNAYPNPSKGKITISLSQASDARYKITVSNTIGKVIKNISVPESAHNSEFLIDLSDKPAGVYFYSLLVNDKMVETKRLIIQQ